MRCSACGKPTKTRPESPADSRPSACGIGDPPMPSRSEKPAEEQHDTLESSDLRAVYRRRFDERDRARERWSLWDRRVADARLIAFVVAVIAAILAYRSGGRASWWLASSGGVFLALVVSHEPIRRAGDRARRAVDFYAKGLARLDETWAGTGVSGSEFLDVDHPYAADLDLFGTGSLFERLCTARTK